MKFLPLCLIAFLILFPAMSIAQNEPDIECLYSYNPSQDGYQNIACPSPVPTDYSRCTPEEVFFKTRTTENDGSYEVSDKIWQCLCGKFYPTSETKARNITCPAPSLKVFYEKHSTWNYVNHQCFNPQDEERTACIVNQTSQTIIEKPFEIIEVASGCPCIDDGNGGVRPASVETQGDEENQPQFIPCDPDDNDDITTVCQIQRLGLNSDLTEWNHFAHLPYLDGVGGDPNGHACSEYGVTYAWSRIRILTVAADSLDRCDDGSIIDIEPGEITNYVDERRTWDEVPAADWEFGDTYILTPPGPKEPKHIDR